MQFAITIFLTEFACNKKRFHVRYCSWQLFCGVFRDISAPESLIFRRETAFGPLAHPSVLKRMSEILAEGRAQTIPESLEILKQDLKALNFSVAVEQEEYDEIMAMNPMFLVMNYVIPSMRESCTDVNSGNQYRICMNIRR